MVLDPTRGSGEEKPGTECADRQRQADNVGQHDAGQHGVGNGIAHQRPAF